MATPSVSTNVKLHEDCICQPSNGVDELLFYEPFDERRRSSGYVRASHCYPTLLQTHPLRRFIFALTKGGEAHSIRRN